MESKFNYIVRKIPVFTPDSENEFFRIHAKITKQNTCSSRHEGEKETDPNRNGNKRYIDKNKSKEVARTEEKSYLYNRNNFDKNVQEHSQNLHRMKNTDTEYFHQQQSKRCSIQYAKTNSLANCDNEDKINDEDIASEHNLIKKTLEIDNIIQEIIDTEERYVNDLRIVIEEYTTLDFSVKKSLLFGNIEDIFAEALNLLMLLKKNHGSAEKIALVFIKEERKLFDLYRHYALNKSKSDAYLKEFSEIIKAKDKELKNSLGLASYLLTPIQRLPRYKLLLERLQKEMKTPTNSIDIAVDKITKVLEKTNDFVKVGSIKYNEMDLSVQGSFIMKEDFAVLKPKKFASTIFLFENIIIVTEGPPKFIDHFVYIDSIKIEDLGIASMEHEEKVFHLTDHSYFKKTKGEIVTYILETKTAEIKSEWVKKLGEMLWKQIYKAKELQKYLNAVKNLPEDTSRNSAKRNNKPKSNFHLYV